MSSEQEKPMSEDDSVKEKSSEIEKESKKKPGVIFLSRVPTKMNVKIIREYMSQFGKVGRIYLEPRGNQLERSEMLEIRVNG